jgi:diguanylate cyclase (GGDEF)-like protein
MRDETADERLETAEHRDRTAELRDRRADAGDRLERSRHVRSSGDEDVLLRAERERAIAAADRARAADDRAKAAADRQDAMRQRDEAFLAQAEARHDLLVAATDELTGAYTRKFGLENLSRELERARRTDDSLTLAFIDVDGLKEVNDVQGHPGGDRLLTRVVETVRANVRAYDVIVRYGGDEFLCGLPHLSRATARDRMDKIAAILSAADAEHSIAYGLAEYDRGDGLDSLIGRADTELLAAKRAHRNRN